MKRLFLLLVAAAMPMGALLAYTVDTTMPQFYFEDESEPRMKSTDEWITICREGDGWGTLSSSGDSIQYWAEIASDHKTVKGWGISTNAYISSANWANNQSTNYTCTYDGQYGDLSKVYLFTWLRWFRYDLVYNSNGFSFTPSGKSDLRYTNEVQLVANGMNRTGYVFGGWTNVNGTVLTGTVTGADIGVDSDGMTATLYAKWIANIYKVTLNKQNGTSGTDAFWYRYNTPQDGYCYYFDADCTQGVANDTITPPTRVGYTFNGYYQSPSDTGSPYVDDSGAIVVSIYNTETANRMLYAKWTANTYTVTFNANGGDTSVDSISVTYDSTYGTLPTSTRDGYKFDGWYTSAGNKITSSSKVDTAADHTLCAHWTAKTIRITFDRQSGSGGLSSCWYMFNTYTNGYHYYSNSSCTSGIENDTMQTPTRSGYVFGGYYTEANGEGTQYVDATGKIDTNLCATIYADIKLWAKWTYEIEFDPNGGSGIMTNMPCTYGVAMTLDTNTFTRTGYTFEGWNTKTNGTGTAYEDGATISSNGPSPSNGIAKFYAQWSANTYTVSFDANGGSVSVGSTNIVYDTTYGELPTPTWIGYLFEGWFSSQDDSGALVSNTTAMVTASNHTLYAHWEMIRYELAVWDEHPSNVVASVRVGYNESIPALDPLPEKEGYTFAGAYGIAEAVDPLVLDERIKYFNADGTGVGQWATNCDGAVGAKWCTNTYYVAYDGNGGNGEMGIEMFTYDVATNLQDNAFIRDTYVFEGWATNASGDVAFTNCADILNLTGIANATNTLYAVWRSILTDYSRAADCTNLVLDVYTNNNWQAWDIDYDLGYGGSTSSVHVAGNCIARLTTATKISGTGTLTFRIRLRTNKTRTFYFSAFRDLDDYTSEIYTAYKNVLLDTDGEWLLCVCSISLAEPGYFVWNYNGSDGEECWIDDVQWYSGKMVDVTGTWNDEWHNVQSVDEHSANTIKTVVLQHWGEILGNQADGVNRIVFPANYAYVTNAPTLLRLGFAPGVDSVSEGTATLGRYAEGSLPSIAITAYPATNHIEAAVRYGESAPKWLDDGLDSVFGVWGATSLTSDWSRVDTGDTCDLSNYANAGEVSWIGFDVSTNRFFKVKAE